MNKRPGGQLALRPLHFLWICDCSKSMEGAKIAELNHAISEAVPAMAKIADDNPYAQVFVRAIRFSDGAVWHQAELCDIHHFQWKPLVAGGLTDMGKGLRLAADALQMDQIGQRAYPPVLVLVSDGYPTDDYKSGLLKLMSLPWGQKAVRIAIGIGDDADLDVLQEFIGRPDIPALRAKNSAQLAHYIRWTSTEVLKAASSPRSRQSGESSVLQGNVLIPTLPMESDPDIAIDVW